jgi:hypothetical protein
MEPYTSSEQYGSLMMTAFLAIVFGGLALLFLIAGTRRLWAFIKSSYQSKLNEEYNKGAQDNYRIGHRNGYALGDRCGHERGYSEGCRFTLEEVRQVGYEQAMINHGITQMQNFANKQSC